MILLTYYILEMRDHYQTYRTNKNLYHDLMTLASYPNMTLVSCPNTNTNIMEIYLIRHGESEANDAGVVQGDKYDTKLTTLGKTQAETTGMYLEKYRIKGNNFDAIYSSPLKRTTETAEIIKNIINHDKDIIYDTRLVGRHKGKLAGLEKKGDQMITILKEFDRLKPEDPIDKYNIAYRDNIFRQVNDKFNIGGESVTNVEKRANEFLKDLIRTNHSKVIITSHRGLLTVLIRCMFNICWVPLPSVSTKVPIISKSNCFISYITYDRTKDKFKLESPPNTDHLDLFTNR